MFLSRYFEGLFAKACLNHELKQEIVTSGLFIDERWAKKLADANLDLIFSIDAFTKKTYEYIRKGAKFDDLVKNISFLNHSRQQNIPSYSH